MLFCIPTTALRGRASKIWALNRRFARWPHAGPRSATNTTAQNPATDLSGGRKQAAALVDGLISVNETPITRNELASLIEGIANAPPDPIEWRRIMVNHYHDDLMETARVRCVQIGLTTDEWTNPTDADVAELRALARGLIPT